MARDDRDVLLFSYGTLHESAVQLKHFGRLLSGRPDSMLGYRQEMVEITDPDVIAVSGKTHHPIVMRSGSPHSRVPGTVFEISAAELLAADAYEVSDYARVRVRLASGLEAWVYIKAD